MRLNCTLGVEMRSSGKYRKAIERDFLKLVLTVLLSAKGSCLHSCHDGFINALVDGPQHFAIEQLIEHFEPHEELADLAASAYLDRFDKRPSGLFAHTDALEYACRIANRFPVSGEVAERLVGCVAKAGWQGRLEYLARALRPHAEAGRGRVTYRPLRERHGSQRLRCA